MNVAIPSGLGAILAIVVLVLTLVFVVVGRIDVVTGALIAGLAAARLT